MSASVELAAWSDLADLTRRLDLCADDVAAIARHARRWVCQGAGFEPSPVCLLRPLATLLDLVAERVLTLERYAVADLAVLRDGIEAFAVDVNAVDDGVRLALPRLT